MTGIRASLIVAVALAAAQAAPKPQVATLSLADGAPARFESGSVIRVPRTRIISRLDVFLPGVKTSSQPSLMLDAAYLRAQRVVQDGQLMLAADTREPRGIFVSDEHRLSVTQIKVVAEQLADWRILRWKDETPYIEASKATLEGVAPDVVIDEPKGGAFLLLTSPARVTIKGRITGQGDFAVRVAGRDVMATADAESATSVFTAQIDAPPDAREIEIAVLNRQTGASRQLLLPIATVR
jgi:hypothetical protein